MTGTTGMVVNTEIRRLMDQLGLPAETQVARCFEAVRGMAMEGTVALPPVMLMSRASASALSVFRVVVSLRALTPRTKQREMR